MTIVPGGRGAAHRVRVRRRLREYGWLGLGIGAVLVLRACAAAGCDMLLARHVIGATRALSGQHGALSAAAACLIVTRCLSEDTVSEGRSADTCSGAATAFNSDRPARSCRLKGK